MLKKMTAGIQSEFTSYYHRLSKHITKPELRFVREACHGILVSKSVIISRLSTQIQDKISLKKTQERFRRHYTKSGFWKELIAGHIQSVRNVFRHNDFLLFDLSDIQKKYATRMEGLKRVYDGSTKDNGPGYWLANILGVRRDGSRLYPLYSKLYSFDMDTISENREYMSAIELVSTFIRKQMIWVFDRGADRQILINYLLEHGKRFIIRMKGEGHLQYLNRVMPLKKVAQQVRLHYHFTVDKIQKNRLVKRRFSGGAVRVRFVHRGNGRVYSDHPLWLVVMKGEGRGYSWYLVSSNQMTSRDVCEECFRGYGHRWKIEEYHRHVKDQYDLEMIQVRTYSGLQSMLSVVTIAMFLLYSQIRYMHDKLILESNVKTMEKNVFRELLGFVYYKITTIVQILLMGTRIQAFNPNSWVYRGNPNQMCLFKPL